jgi:hypothetical protein
MKRKHLILLATPVVVLATLYAGRYALILRSNAERERILTELRDRLTFGMPEAEVRTELEELGLRSTESHDATGLGEELTIIVYYDAYHDELDTWSYMLDTRLGPTAKGGFVMLLTPDGQFRSIE